MVRRYVALAVLCIGALFALPVLAQASESSNIVEPPHEPGTKADGWQSINCTSDTPVQCSPETPELFFKKAGGHPGIGFTQYIIQHEPITLLPSPPYPPGSATAPIKAPKDQRTIKTLRVELPAGLTVNPEATERCPLATFQARECGTLYPGSVVGYEEATLVTNEPNVELKPGFFAPEGFIIPPSEEAPFTKVPVYALVPAEGEPALNGFIIAGVKEVFLETDVAWQSDYHESFRIKMPENDALGHPNPPFSTLISRQVSFGQAGNGTYITNPTTCFNPEEAGNEELYSTFFRAESYGEEDPEFPFGTTPIPTRFPEGVIPTGCQNVPFEPGLKVTESTSQVDSPTGPTVVTTLPFIEGGNTISESHLKKAEVALPEGMGVNPSAAPGLTACTDAQFGKGTRSEAVGCPAGSKIGTVEIESPPLPPGSLKGDVFLGQQLSTDPTSGEEFRFFIEARSTETGVITRLVGNTRANPKTGQVTAVLADNPQVPFESVTLKFDPSVGVLTSAPVCAPLAATSTMEPWSTPASTRHPASEYELSSAPGGGACPKTLGTRPFTPSYTATSQSDQAGAYSPFRVQLTRADGQQELKVVDATLPPGHAGSLKGIPYCSDASLAAAAAASGKAEQASPSCSSASLVGEAQTESGSGPMPAKLAGKVYLTGPYKGAPVSLAVITPAVSGPFDLGTVVVRIALNIDPQSTQVHAVSDVIPDVYGGVKLDIRKIDLNLNREKFMHNPTNCDPSATTGTIKGGGSDPSNPAAFSSYPFSTPYQATGCESLAFKPKLQTQLLGGRSATKRLAHPKLKATLEGRETDANIQRTALVLSASEQLDQSHIGMVCTNPQLASQTCPSASVYGKATAVSPLLNEPLTGPVYLVPSGNKLPDLVADLRGQINVQLHGVIGNQKGAGLKTVFNALPDAPVTKFTLEMNGGKKGLLINSKDLCKHPAKSQLNIKAQNGKQVKNKKLPLQTSGCPKKKK